MRRKYRAVRLRNLEHLVWMTSGTSTRMTIRTFYVTKFRIWMTVYSVKYNIRAPGKRRHLFRGTRSIAETGLRHSWLQASKRVRVPRIVINWHRKCSPDSMRPVLRRTTKSIKCIGDPESGSLHQCSRIQVCDYTKEFNLLSFSLSLYNLSH